MGKPIFIDLQRYQKQTAERVISGVHEGRIIKLNNNPKVYSVQLRNEYVINNVVGAEGYEKYTDVVVSIYGDGQRATIIKAQNQIQYTVNNYQVIT